MPYDTAVVVEALLALIEVVHDSVIHKEGRQVVHAWADEGTNAITASNPATSTPRPASLRAVLIKRSPLVSAEHTGLDRIVGLPLTVMPGAVG